MCVGLGRVMRNMSGDMRKIQWYAAKEGLEAIYKKEILVLIFTEQFTFYLLPFYLCWKVGGLSVKHC